MSTLSSDPLPIAWPGCLRGEEFSAIRALQAGDPAPASDDPVWHDPIAMRLVWLDLRAQAAEIHLTELGQRYPST
jgi:hypothetical protein